MLGLLIEVECWQISSCVCPVQWMNEIQPELAKCDASWAAFGEILRTSTGMNLYINECV